MDISRLPRFSLAHLPTPLQRAERLGAALGGLDLWIKRDDCTGLALGGNKTRKLEYSLGEALARGADTLVTCGGYQSNHVRQTAAAAAVAGLACHAVISVSAPDLAPSYLCSGNVLLDGLLGARLHVAEDPGAGTDATLQALMARLLSEGRKPFLIPLGASDGIGAVGYVAAAYELLEQCRLQDFELTSIVLVTGSAGTHAGLLAGLRAAGSRTVVIGISCSGGADGQQSRVRRVLDDLGQRMALPAGLSNEAIVVHDEWRGPGYAIPSESGIEAIRLAARTEGLLLDPVYTGKGMAGLIGLARRGVFGRDDKVVFLHTGGAPALFAYEDSFNPSPSALLD